LPFQSDSIKYFDIVDEAKLTKQIEDFLSNNKLPPLNAYFIVGQECLIEKEFVLGNEIAINQFLELIPYEIVFSKRILKPKSVVVSAFNGDFYRIVNEIIEKYHGRILSVLPCSQILENTLNSQTALSVLKKADALKNESMTAIGEKEEFDQPIYETKKVEEKSSLPLLLLIFFILLVILIIVVIVSSKNQVTINNSNKIPPSPTVIVIPSPTNFPLSPIPETSVLPTKTATNSAL